MQRAIAFCLLFLACCSGGNPCLEPEAIKRWMEPNGRLKVLCTIGMIADLVEQIGGEQVDVLTLITAGLDPHSYQLVKGDDEKFLAADAVFYNGLELEHGPSLRHYLIENKKAVSVGNSLLDLPGVIMFVDGLPDPHIWMDIALWAKGIEPIVKTLSDFRPEYENQFQLRGKALYQRMQEAHHRIKNHVHQLPAEKRFLVTSHDAFNYFTRAYLSADQELEDDSWEKRCAAPEGLAPDSMLSVADIQDIIAHLKEYQVEVIFSESNINQDSIRKIVDAGREKGLTIRIADCALYSDAMGCPGSDADTHIKMVEFNARCIVEQLQ